MGEAEAELWEVAFMAGSGLVGVVVVVVTGVWWSRKREVGREGERGCSRVEWKVRMLVVMSVEELYQSRNEELLGDKIERVVSLLVFGTGK